MLCLILYHTRFGNTGQVAAVLAAELEQAGSVQRMTFKQLDLEAIEKAHLLVVGAPTHGMNLPEPVRAALWPGSHPLAQPARLRQAMAGKPVATFDTSYRLPGWLARFSAGPRLMRRLRQLGGRQLVPPVSFLVSGRSGPLQEGEIERARAWAGLLLERIHAVYELDYHNPR
jgi:flavodoxin